MRLQTHRLKSTNKMEYFEFELKDTNLGLQRVKKKTKHPLSVYDQQRPPGSPLFIGLHDGGGGGGGNNEQEAQKGCDRAWMDMSKGVYRINVVKAEVYIAPRDIVNVWDLHFRPESVYFGRGT